MKVNTYRNFNNERTLQLRNNAEIYIKKGIWKDNKDKEHALRFEKNENFTNKNVYFLYDYGDINPPIQGRFIVLNPIQNLRFIWMQKSNKFKIIFSIIFGALIILLSSIDSFFSILSFFNVKP